MINSIEIRNYRNLKELKINSLARINLIIGKNNIGKSTFLEAIAIYVSKGDLRTIYQLLNDRGENYIQNANKDNITEIYLKTFSSLFSNREISYKKDGLISIITNENQQSPLSIRFVRYIEKESTDENDGEPVIKRIVIDELDNSINDAYYGLEINTGTGARIRPLDRDYPVLKGKNNHNFQYLRARNVDNEINGILWDNITLTEKETFVIEGLKIISPDIERVAFVQESPKQRTTVIKLKTSDTVIPMKSMGDGVNRIFNLILAIVNAENGYLLIDEFENGLHHSVQRKLWDIIFKLSGRLNVQVFATTHSNDCIMSFEEVLNSSENKNEGKAIRIHAQNGQNKEIEFSARELKIAADQNIEIR